MKGRVADRNAWGSRGPPGVVLVSRSPLGHADSGDIEGSVVSRT